MPVEDVADGLVTSEAIVRSSGLVRTGAEARSASEAALATSNTHYARVTAEHVEAVVTQPTGARVTVEHVEAVIQQVTGVRIAAEYVEVLVRGSQGVRTSAEFVEVVVVTHLALGQATSAVTFDATGLLGAIAPLEGTSAVEFGATGTMELRIALGGQSDLVTAAEADLEVTPGWELSGSSDWIFGASGDLRFVPTMAGQVDIDLDFAGNLTEIAPLEGELDVDLDLDIQPLPLYGGIDININITGRLLTFVPPVPAPARVGFLHINPRILPQPGDFELVPSSNVPLPLGDDPDVWASGTNARFGVQANGAPTGGTWTLSYGGYTTSPIPWNADASTDTAVLDALSALTSIEVGNVQVAGALATYLEITFVNDLGAQPITGLTAAGAGLTGPDAPYTVTASLWSSGSYVTAGPFDRPYGLDEYAYATSADGRYLYIISGYWWGQDWEQWWSNRIYRWDMEDLAWTELAHIPDHIGSEGCCAARIDDKIYVLMGDSEESDIFDPELVDGWVRQSMWIYDITADTWTRGTQPLSAQDYGGCAALDGILYSVPSYDTDGYTPTFFSYDPVADVWTQLVDLPEQLRDVPNMWAGDGKIWVMGNLGDAPYSARVFSYDPGAATPSWTDETSDFEPFPNAQMYASAVIPLSSTVVRLVGGANNNTSTYDVNVVAKTITDARLTLREQWSYFGGAYYEGNTFVVMGDEAHVEVSWRVD